MKYNVKENLLQIQEEIAPYTPNIIAVTKYYDKNAIIEAFNSGLRNFAEARAIEATEKINCLEQNIRDNSYFHFIGHLQTNKVKKVVTVFDFIHSVDSLKIAQKISDEAQKINKVQKVLIQINNANEEQKTGFSKTELFENFKEMQKLSNISIVGLMNMAPLGASNEKLESLFSEVKLIRDTLEKEFNCELKELSMGMSQDYKIAARMGSTMLRIGRKLFS